MANINAVLFFDQPSQAHYPAEQGRIGDAEVLPDEHREAVYKLFKLIADVGQELSPGFQVIIADHADLRELGLPTLLSRAGEAWV